MSIDFHRGLPSPASARDSDRPTSFLPLLSLMLCSAWLLAGYFDFVPLWDGLWHYACLATASSATPFSWTSPNCSDHVSLSYYLPFLVLHRIAGPTPFVLHAGNVALGLFAVVLCFSLLRRLLPGVDRGEAALLTSLLALDPAWLALQLNFSQDFGQAVYLLAFLAALLAGSGISAAVAGFLLLFAKETGAVLYYLALCALLFVKPLRPRQSWALLLPAVLYPLYVTFLIRHPSSLPFREELSWEKIFDTVESIPMRPSLLVDFDLGDPVLRSLLADIFLLNFHWVGSLILVAAACFVFVNRRTLRTTASWWVVAAGFVLSIYVVTRIRPHAHVRYVLITYPFFVLLVAGALYRLVPHRRLRLSVLVFWTALLAVSVFRTVDPVSKLFYKTYSFGNRTVLAKAQFGPVPYHGQDETTYNLQFLYFHYLLNKLLADLKPSPDLEVYSEQTHFTPGWVDRGEFQRTTGIAEALWLQFIHPHLLKSVPPRCGDYYFVDFYNREGPAIGLAERYGALREVRRYTVGGYSAELFRFSRTGCEP